MHPQLVRVLPDQRAPCVYCRKGFTPLEILTGEMMKNERHQSIHFRCYNDWCEANPMFYTDAEKAHMQSVLDILNMRFANL